MGIFGVWFSPGFRKKAPGCFNCFLRLIRSRNPIYIYIYINITQYSKFESLAKFPKVE